MIDTSTTESAGTFGVLTRLFIRRLVDHDTLSPHADRRESLATLAAVLLSVAVFVTFFLAKNYLASFVLLPGPTALNALTDWFLLFAGSIAIGGLGALMVWMRWRSKCETRQSSVRCRFVRARSHAPS
ncbi:MAG: hypothetical protein QM736_20890 [Vicinamibacterales bacterium]